jgi:dihydroxyacetone kinase-like protein
MATEMANMEDIVVRTVLVKDDAASAPPEEADRRRGVAGMVFAFKIAGAKADQGADLDAVEAVTRKALDNIRTIGVALSPVTLPAVGRPTFTIGEDEMEIGMGIHGEPGMKREQLQSADTIVERMTAALLEDMPLQAGDRVAVMVNSLGATPPEELYIMYRKVHNLLSERGAAIHRPYIGRFATSMEMAGASLTFFKLDDQLAALLDHPAQSPFFVQV